MSPSQEVALRQITQSAVAQLQDEGFLQQVQLAVPEGVSSRQLLRVAATAVLENPKLAAPNLRASLLKETLKCAQYGLLPDGNQAAFVIYKIKGLETIRLQLMIAGLRGIAADHGWTIQTAVVYENDQFDPDLDAHRANHKPAPLGQDRGKPIGAYAIAHHRDGRRMGPEIFTLDDIEKVRKVSRAKDDGPWVTWWERMAEKSPGKRLFKKLSLDPKDRRIGSVLKDLEEEDRVDALYGPDPNRAESETEDADWQPTAEAGDEGEEPLNEPSDEELAALGSSDENGDEVPAELKFERGKFAGFTIEEVYANGDVGVGYLKWALRDWADGDFKEALRAFAAEHPDLSEGE